MGDDEKVPDDSKSENQDDDVLMGDRFARVTVPPGLGDKRRRKAWGLPEDEDQKGQYLIELNLQHVEGLSGAVSILRSHFDQLELDRSQLRRVAKTYYGCKLTVHDVRRLAAKDEGRAANQRAIYRIWPDFKVRGLIDRSLPTVKADAASRAFGADGEGIVWAVLDSGVDAEHPHFYPTEPPSPTPTNDGEAAEGEGQADDLPRSIAGHRLLDESVYLLHRCFCEVSRKRGPVQVKEYLADPEGEEDEKGRDETEEKRRERREQRIRDHVRAALGDEFGHGTHVAGIISGRVPNEASAVVLERQFKEDPFGEGTSSKTMEYGLRSVASKERLRGVAPSCKLVSLRVLDEQGDGRTSDVLQALEYIRQQLNDDPKLLRVHGVNLSVGYEFDAELFACGQSPICSEVDRLVQAGVVVVAAAGNTGYGTITSAQRLTRVGLSNTINDPGNAALAITVGATHRDAPHTYGVSYFSSKGPTGDGRLKPDLVAPGERITSCATGKKLEDAWRITRELAERGGGEKAQPETRNAYYVDDSGTSMAAPHVSGAIAAFLSIRREFVGKPLEVKRIFVESATSLGRERYFEGHGLVDMMRAIQSV